MADKKAKPFYCNCCDNEFQHHQSCFCKCFAYTFADSSTTAIHISRDSITDIAATAREPVLYQLFRVREIANAVVATE